MSLYTSTVQKLPAPNFVVFYNGEEAMADRGEYRLSDAFEHKVDNPALMEQCRTLADYAQYVTLVRKYKAEQGSLVAAVRQAVDECIKNDVLADFLRNLIINDKETILKELDKLSINRVTLFPEIDDVSEYLKGKYGKSDG